MAVVLSLCSWFSSSVETMPARYTSESFLPESGRSRWREAGRAGGSDSLPSTWRAHFSQCFVQLEIRLEGGEDTVLLAFHHFIGLIDGEVEGGHELSVLPGLVNVELVVEFTVTWQKIDNNPTVPMNISALYSKSLSENSFFVLK